MAGRPQAHLLLLLGLLSGTTSGCGGPANPPPAPSDGTPAPAIATPQPGPAARARNVSPEQKDAWLEVLTDPREVTQATDLARQGEEAEVRRLLSGSARQQFLDSRDLELLERHRAEILPTLEQRVAAPTITDEQVGAALLLCRLLEPAGRPAILRVLRSGNETQRLWVLGAIDVGASIESEREGRHRAFLFAEPGLDEALVSQLQDLRLQIVKSAIQCCGILKVPGFQKGLLQLAETDTLPPQEQDRLLYWLSKGDVTGDVFDLAVRATEASPDNDPAGLPIFESVAKAKAHSLKRRAIEELRKALARWNDDGKLGFSGTRLGLLEALSGAAEAEELPWVQELATSERGLYANAPLLAWIRLDPKTGRDIVMRWITSPSRRLVAVRGARDGLAGSQDGELVTQLRKNTSRLDRKELLLVCEAIRAVGGERAQPALDTLVSGLDLEDVPRFQPPPAGSDPATKETADEKGTGRGVLDRVAAAVREAGILDPAEIDRGLQAFDPEELANDAPVSQFIGLMLAANRLAGFDAESDVLPCRHDRLLTRIAAESGGRFAPTAAREEWHRKSDEDFEADYTLTFVHGGRVYRGRLRNFGDWYDVERLSLMINQALEEAGSVDRFVGVATKDQFVSRFFAPPEAAARLARTLSFELETDPSAAMQAGKEFENRVRQRIGNE